MDINFTANDDLNLTRTIKDLCLSHIRSPLAFEEVKAWLKQFDSGPEKRLALLILRFLVFRTNEQLTSSLRQALKSAAVHFWPSHLDSKRHWKEVYDTKLSGISFSFGPPSHENTPPGKSGHVVTRLIEPCLDQKPIYQEYPKNVGVLKDNERFLVVDDAAFTGNQLNNFFLSEEGERLVRNVPRVGIVLGLVHEKALRSFRSEQRDIEIFYGEIITESECFESMAKMWEEKGWWGFDDCTPFEVYMDIIEKKAKFDNDAPLGFGSLGCMVSFGHGKKAPDDSLQLLWDSSRTWAPLFSR